jgi:hypothetical protein
MQTINFYELSNRNEDEKENSSSRCSSPSDSSDFFKYDQARAPFTDITHLFVDETEKRPPNRRMKLQKRTSGESARLFR